MENILQVNVHCNVWCIQPIYFRYLLSLFPVMVITKLQTMLPVTGKYEWFVFGQWSVTK